MNLKSPNNNPKYSRFFLYTKETLVVIAIVLLPSIFPETAQASLFSFFSSLAGQNVSAKETAPLRVSYNSQTMPLLEAAVNTKPMPTLADALSIADNTLVPSVGPSGSMADIDNQPGSTAISTYVVRPGDTLFEIATMFDVSVNTIVWANSLGTRPVIQPGQTLVILPVSGVNYTIKKGDTLASITKKYGGDQNEIMEYNGLTSAALAVGQTIIIPDGEIGGSNSASGARPTPGNIYEPYLGGGGPVVPGYYACPVRGAWLSQGLHGHNAVDLALGVGNPIYAAADGTVIIAKTGGWNGGYGSYVVISHSNGTETLYAHAEKLYVAAGEKITQGEEIAKIGVTGETTGPHIHFEVRGAANPFATVKC